VKAHIHEAKLDDINGIFTEMKAGKIDGRMVVSL
jgi:propanol-preferring alcohol dehydrogenase